MSQLLRMFANLPGNHLARADLDTVESSMFIDLLPADAREFFLTYGGGVFRFPPLTMHILPDALNRSVNERFKDEYLSQTFPYYDKCILFADAELDHFSLGLDLNQVRRGWVFGYEDEGRGVSANSYYIFRSFTEWLEDTIATKTPTGVRVPAASVLGPVLRP